MLRRTNEQKKKKKGKENRLKDKGNVFTLEQTPTTVLFGM
jgi:hypothetical protein